MVLLPGSCQFGSNTHQKRSTGLSVSFIDGIKQKGESPGGIIRQCFLKEALAGGIKVRRVGTEEGKVRESTL